MSEEKVEYLVPASEINVLGTIYKIKHGSVKDYPKLKDAVGLCEKYTKEIILDIDGYNDPDSFDNMIDYDRHTLRHEIAHAFLHESGFDSNLTYDQEERIVGWISQMVTKYYNACKEANALEDPQHES